MATLSTADHPSPAAEPVSGPSYSVEVFFDGDCPLCKREIAMLERWDKRDAIRFTDIAAEEFNPASVGVPMETLMEHIHGRLPDGRVVTGVEVFRQLYSAIGLGWLVAPTRLPGVRHALDASYRLFARYRVPAGRWLSGSRCKDQCDLPRQDG